MKNIIFIFIILSFFILEKSIAGNVSDVAIHGFISQGYLKSSGNNFIADSKDGTFQFNEMGINFGTTPLPGLHIGVQFFAHDFGKTGNDEIVIDWALADFKWKPYLNIKVGKIKIPHGFFHETRDFEMLRVSILLPQSVYTDNIRDSLNALKGGGIYGKFTVPVIGRISYQILGGTENISENGSLAYYTESRLRDTAAAIDVESIDVNSFTGYSVTWHTNIKGLTFNYSGTAIDMEINSILANSGFKTTTYLDKLKTHIYSMKYSFHNFLFISECMLQNQPQENIVYMGEKSYPAYSTKKYFLGNYAGISYSFGETVELGYYYSLFYVDRHDKTGKNITPSTIASEKDHCISFRYNLNEYWTLKIEDHIVKGAALLTNSDNPPDSNGDRYKKNWNLFALKLSYRF